MLGDTSKINYITQIDRNIVKELLFLLFQRKDIDHNDIFSITRFLLFKEKKIEKNEIEQKINLNISLTKNSTIQNLLKDELFILMMQKSLGADYFLEKLLIFTES